MAIQDDLDPVATAQLRRLPAATATIDAILDALDADGACIVTDLLDDAALAELEGELAPWVAANDTGSDDFTGRDTRRTGALVARSPMVRELLVHPLILGAAERFLEPWCARLQLHLTQVISIGPGESRQMLHTDRLAWGGYIPRPIEPQFNTIWALTDFTEENGATHVIPGSHRLDDTAWRSADVDDTVRATMPAGSVLIYTGSVIHGGGANYSDAVRSGINLTYCLSWLRTEENQFLSCPPDTVRALGLEKPLTDLLGYTHANYAMGYWSNPDEVHGNDLLPPEAAVGLGGIDGFGTRD